MERIRGMLEGGSPELQCAAAMVLGELRPKDPAVRGALLRAVKSAPESVRLYAVEALTRIDPETALPYLLPLLSGPEPGRSRAAKALASMGPAAARELRRCLGKADARTREGILEVLGRFREVDTTEALFAGLLDPDQDVVRKAALAFVRRIEALSPQEKRRVLADILQFMGSPRVRRARAPLAACLEVVGAAGDPSAVKKVLPYLGSSQPPPVRTAALHALARMPLEGNAAASTAAELLPLLEEADFEGVVKPALDILGKIPPVRAWGERLLRLAGSPQPQLKLFALKALGSVGTPAAAAALLEALASDDPQAAERAEAALGSNPAYVPFLVKALERPGDQSRAWKITNVLRARKDGIDGVTARRLLSRLQALLDLRDARAPAFFEVLRSAAPEALRDALVRKGRGFMSRGRFGDAERVLRLLHSDDLATPETELALAIARLRHCIQK